MGFIAKQGIKNSLSSFWGIFIGAIYTIFIVPRAFDSNPEYWGLIQYMVYLSQILIPIIQLSLPNIIIKFFPEIQEKKRADFLFFLLAILSISCLFGGLLFGLLGKHASGIDDQELYESFYYLVIPLFTGTVFFEIFSTWSRSMLRSEFPTFLRESFSKTWILFLILIFWVEWISFSEFILLYVLNPFIQICALLYYLISRKLIVLKFSFSFFKNNQSRPFVQYGAFSLLAGTAATLVTKLDILMIGNMLGLDKVAFYSIPLFMSNVILVPLKAIQNIAVPLIASFWIKKNLRDIHSLYRQVSYVAFFVGSFIFLGIWLNIDFINSLLGSKFGHGQYVFFFLGLGRLFDISCGINGNIIITSSKYKMDLVFQVFLVLFTVLSNLLLIPIMGIEGAALATAISIILYNLVKVIFVRRIFQMFPFSRNTIVVFVVFVIIMGLNQIIPHHKNLYLDVFFRSFSLIVIYIIFTIKLKILTTLNFAQNKSNIKR